MIKINLVPLEQRAKKKNRAFLTLFKNIPPEVSVGLVGGFLVLVFVINILFQAIIMIGALNNKRLIAVWEGMGSERGQVSKITEGLDRSRQKLTAIENIKKATKISWAQKLNVISDIILPGIWLDRLSLDKDKLEIAGYSVSKKGDHLMNVNRFNAVLKNNPSFMQGFKTVEVASVERKIVEGVGLANFTIIATLDKNYEHSLTP